MKRRLIAGTINWYWPEEEGWINYHLDVSERGVWDPEIEMTVAPQFPGASISDLAIFRDDTFDEVRAHHVLEHLSLYENERAAEAVWRVLRSGGVFDVEVPDVERVAAGIVSGDLSSEDYNQWLHGEQLANHEGGDSHRFAFSEATLRDLLGSAGFEVGEREETGLALRLIARKPIEEDG